MKVKLPVNINNELVKIRDDINKSVMDCIRKSGSAEKGYRMFKRKYNNILRDNGSEIGCYIEYKRNDITVKFYAFCKDNRLEISSRIDLGFVTKDFTMANTYKNMSGMFRVTELDAKTYFVECMSFDWSKLTSDKKSNKKK